MAGSRVVGEVTELTTGRKLVGAGVLIAVVVLIGNGSISTEFQPRGSVNLSQVRYAVEYRRKRTQAW